jgi:hypothetical protein
MIATRLRQLGMLLFSMLLCAVAFFQMFERTTNGFPQNYVWMLAFVSALFLTAWGLLLRFQPHADQSVMCCVMVLTGIGVTMIARLDQALFEAMTRAAEVTAVELASARKNNIG